MLVEREVGLIALEIESKSTEECVLFLQNNVGKIFPADRPPCPNARPRLCLAEPLTAVSRSQILMTGSRTTIRNPPRIWIWITPTEKNNCPENIPNLIPDSVILLLVSFEMRISSSTCSPFNRRTDHIFHEAYSVTMVAIAIFHYHISASADAWPPGDEWCILRTLDRL